MVENDLRHEGEVGIGLVRAAFNPTGGPQTLIDMKLPAAERERMVDLFVGGIATFKDPVSHKVLGNCGPASVFEVLKFASQLLSYCDELCPARLCARTRWHD